MKRRIELRIDELRLPPGSRTSLRARDAIASAVASLLRDGRPPPAQRTRETTHDAIAAGVRDGVAPHLSKR